MVSSCSISDIDRILYLGSLINKNFKRVNDIEKIIEENKIIGYYDNNRLVGFLIYDGLYEVVDLLYIVVDPIYRRLGIASELMNYLIDNEKFDKVMLEVRCDNNSAIRLYKKFNFKIVNIREKYYENMDAYVMEMVR